MFWVKITDWKLKKKAFIPFDNLLNKTCQIDLKKVIPKRVHDQEYFVVIK